MEIENQQMEEESHLESTQRAAARRGHSHKTKRSPEEDTEHLNAVRSVSSLESTAAVSPFIRRPRRSAASSCEGAVPAGTTGLASSRGRLSSCSTVRITEEQLMLNPVKPEVGGKHVINMI